MIKVINGFTLFLTIVSFAFMMNAFAQEPHKVGTEKTLTKKYTIKISDLPDDIKGYAQLIAPGKKHIKASAAELSKALTIMAAVEKKMPGITAKLGQFAQSHGYDGGVGNIYIKCDDLLAFASELLAGIPYADELKGKMTSALSCVETKKGYPVFQPIITQLLAKTQEIENTSQGMTQRARCFLSSKYGF